MKIAFLGKGGAGKSTVSASFIRSLQLRERFVLAVDADINRHLGSYLGIPSTVPDLGERFAEIFEYLERSRFDALALDVVPELGTLPPGEQSRRIQVSPDDGFLRRFASFGDSCALLTVGTYEEADFGTTCIHVKQKGLELAVHRLEDRSSEVVVFDSTAGADPLSTSLCWAYDLQVMVVEPTRKSVRVVEDYLRAAAPVAHRIRIIANKVQSLEDEDFIKRHVPRELLIGLIPEDDSIHRFCRGERDELNTFVRRHQFLWEELERIASSLPPAREVETQMLVKNFRDACSLWANTFYGTKLDTLILNDTVPMEISHA